MTASPTATLEQHSPGQMTLASPGDVGSTDRHGGATVAGQHDSCIAGRRRHQSMCTVGQHSPCNMTPPSAGDGGITDGHGGATIAGQHDSCADKRRLPHRRLRRSNSRRMTRLLRRRATAEQP
jgi:hypothetical protein